MDKEAKRKKILSFKKGSSFIEKYIFTNRGGVRGKKLTPLGTGGSGVVYLVKHRLYDTVFINRAIKFYVFRDDIADIHTKPVSVQNFKDELVNLASLNHESILKIIEVGLWKKGTLPVPFLVTEYIEGSNLKDALDNEELKVVIESNPRVLIDMIIQICTGLKYLHGQKFYHCDIAPKNIFLKNTLEGIQVVIGDLGAGRTVASNLDKKVLIIGTKDYSPHEVIDVMGTERTIADFAKLQPKWDMFGLAKTCKELVEAASKWIVEKPAWFGALKKCCDAAFNDNRYASVADFLTHIQYLHPASHTTWGVPELSSNMPKKRSILIPIEEAIVSDRIKRVFDHPAMLRLKLVPQLVMGSRIHHGGNHHRYEHSLGVYQNMRETLLALIEDAGFLADFKPVSAEMALLAAALYNICYCPLWTVIKEIDPDGKSGFDNFSRSNLIDYFTNERFETKQNLVELIADKFPDVNFAELKNLLYGQSELCVGDNMRLIFSLLNSSIDARVIDYVRRDSHHLGLASGDPFDLRKLLPHLVYFGGHLVVKSSGQSAVEQLITLRYWLYSRIYMNQPNRAMISMLKYAIHRLRTVLGTTFGESLYKTCISSSETDTIRSLLKDASSNPQLSDVAIILEMLLKNKPVLYKQVMQCSEGDVAPDLQKLCRKYKEMSFEKLFVNQTALNNAIKAELRDDFGGANCVLLDMTKDIGMSKWGDDLEIQTFQDGKRALPEVSGIVKGVSDGFRTHIQRLRVLVHPNVEKKLDTLPLKNEVIRKLIMSTI